MGSVDWKEAQAEAVEHLQRLLQFETVNPPGNERPCVEYVADTLAGVGYDPVVLDSAPGRGNVVARLRGTGESSPLLIYGHVDVVPVEEQKWTRPPFAGAIADGCVWGRGALDMKDMVSFELETMLLLAQNAQH